MAVSLTDLKTKINGMTDLSDTTFNDIFVDYDSTVVSQDDVYAELEKKIVELFEKFTEGKDAATIAAEITSIKGRVSATGRLDTKGATIETKLKDVAKDIDDINGKIGSLSSNYGNDTFINDLLADISVIQSSDVRAKFYKIILDDYKDNHFANNDDAAAAVREAQDFWNTVNSVISRGSDNLNSVISYADYGVEVGRAWTNVQNGHVGAYKELLDDITSLETSLGAFDDEAKIDAEITRLDTVEVTNIENSFKLGIYSDMRNVIDNGIENFIEVASDTEISDFKADLAVAVTSSPILGDTRLESVYNDAIAKLNAASTGRTAKAKTDIENDITNTYQPAYDAKKADFDAAEVALADETYNVTEVLCKSLGDLNAAKTGLEAQKTTPGLTEDQIAAIDKKLAFIDAELLNRGTDALLAQSTRELEEKRHDMLDALSLPDNYDVTLDKDSRDWLIENVLAAKLSDVCVYNTATSQYERTLNTTLENDIRSKFDTAQADMIINTFIQNEFFAPGARVDAVNIRHEWWAECSSVELNEMYSTGFRLDGTTRLTADELLHIKNTINERESIPNRDWFVASNNFLTTAELEEIKKINDEIDRRKGNVASLQTDRDAKKAAFDAAEADLNNARAQVYSRENFDNYVQKRTNRDNALTANTAARTNLDTTMRDDAIKLKLNREVKAAYDRIMTDAEAHFNGQDKVEQADIDAFVNGHADLAVLNTHPKANELKTQLVAEIGRRVNKVKTATNGGTNKVSWLKSVGSLLGGNIIGLGASCVPGVSTIGMALAGTVLTVSAFDIAGNLASKFVHWRSEKAPNGICKKFLDALNGVKKPDGSWDKQPKKGLFSIIRGVNNCRRKINEFVERHPYITRAAQGFASGYVLGNLHELASGEPLWKFGSEPEGEPIVDPTIVVPENWPADVDYNFWSNYVTGDPLNFEGLRGYMDSYAARGMYSTASENASLFINPARAAFSEGTFGYSFRLPDDSTFVGSFKDLMEKGVDYAKCAVRGQNNGGDLAWYNLLDVMKNGKNVLKTGGYTR